MTVDPPKLLATFSGPGLSHGSKVGKIIVIIDTSEAALKAKEKALFDLAHFYRDQKYRALVKYS
jgi:hypothetical protein